MSGEPVAPHPGYGGFATTQIGRVLDLVADIVRRHRLDPHRVFAHSDVAPARKLDPGELFPWRDLAARGLGWWVEPEPAGA